MNSTLDLNSSRSARDEVEHLGLDGRVEAGGRLVEDQQRRVLGQRHRDDHALLHAAGELVRVAAHHAVGVGDLDLLEHRPRPLVRLVVLDALEREHLGDLVADPDRRVQRAPSGSGRPSRPWCARSWRTSASLMASRSSPATEIRAAAHAAVARQVAQRRERRRRLAAAGLADEPVGLALGDLQADAAQDAPPVAADAVGDLEVGELEGVRGGGRCGGHRSNAFAMPSAMQVDADHEGRDGERREQHRPPVAAADQPVVLEDLQAPVGSRRLDAEAEEAQRRDGEDRVAEPDGELDEDRAHHVRAGSRRT